MSSGHLDHIPVGPSSFPVLGTHFVTSLPSFQTFFTYSSYPSLYSYYLPEPWVNKGRSRNSTVILRRLCNRVEGRSYWRSIFLVKEASQRSWDLLWTLKDVVDWKVVRKPKGTTTGRSNFANFDHRFVFLWLSLVVPSSAPSDHT